MNFTRVTFRRAKHKYFIVVMSHERHDTSATNNLRSLSLSTHVSCSYWELVKQIENVESQLIISSRLYTGNSFDKTIAQKWMLIIYSPVWLPFIPETQKIHLAEQPGVVKLQKWPKSSKIDSIRTLFQVTLYRLYK